MEIVGTEAMRVIAGRLRDEAGLTIGDDRVAMVSARLGRRLRELGIASFDDYAGILDGQGDAAIRERRHLVNAMTTNVTGFFREPHHFETAAAFASDHLARMPGATIACWSAGGSNGSEAVSLALAILEACPDLPPDRLRITATDIDDDAVAAMSEGWYPEASLDPALRERHASRLASDGAGRIGLRGDLRRCIAARWHNLVGAEEMRGGFDIVMCRNVTIYFEPATRARAQGALLRTLRPGGILCLGHSERLAAAPDAAGDAEQGQVTRIGVTTYQKDAARRWASCR